MKKKVFALMNKAGKLLPALALLVAVASVDSACHFLFHQPEIPEGMAKFRK